MIFRAANVEEIPVSGMALEVDKVQHTARVKGDLRLNSFERLIWSVTKRELRLIIYLGGFLGAVIGSLIVVLQAPVIGAAYLGTMLVASYLFINFR